MLRMKQFKALRLGALVITLGISIYVITKERHFQNQPLVQTTGPVCENTQYVSRARTPSGYAPPTQCLDELRDVFVGVAISGGGSRAANFGLGVLKELDDLGILEHVSAISAVSGGTLAASYFSIYGEEPHWAENAVEIFSTDILQSWILKNLNPINIARVILTNEDRTDLLAETFNEKLFNGNSPLYGELGKIGRRRPTLLISATDITHGGRIFTYTEDSFQRIGSRIDNYPIASAMASSAAFPAVMNAATLKDYRIPEAQGSEPEYLHLIDGGPADNLGVRSLIEHAKGYVVRSKNFNIPFRGCFIMVVDAGLPVEGKIYRKKPDRRGAISHIIDLDFFDAIDTMLWHQRHNSLNEIGIFPSRSTDTPQYVRSSNNNTLHSIRPYNRISSTLVKIYSEQQADGRPGFRTEARAHGWLIGPNRPQIDIKQQESAFECSIWHIPLDGVQHLEPWTRTNGEDPKYNHPNQLKENPSIQYRLNLSEIVTGIETNFRLTGPGNCSAQTLQKALFDSARVLVAEDHISRPKACAWFRRNGLSVNNENCDKTPPSLAHKEVCHLQ